MTTEPPPLDVERILATLTRHGVEFLLVGGVAAIAHGARRLTVDLDCVPVRTYENLDRLAAALRDLNARLRVEGLRTQSRHCCLFASIGNARPDGTLNVAD